jgi:hypothetical protein
VRLLEHPFLPAPLAGGAHESARARGERLVESLGAGREVIVAVAAPVTLRRAPCSSWSLLGLGKQLHRDRDLATRLADCGCGREFTSAEL